MKRPVFLWQAAGFAFAAVGLIGVLFVVFTFAPPQLPLFKDPIAGTYEIKSQ